MEKDLKLFVITLFGLAFFTWSIYFEHPVERIIFGLLTIINLILWMTRTESKIIKILISATLIVLLYLVDAWKLIIVIAVIYPIYCLTQSKPKRRGVKQ